MRFRCLARSLVRPGGAKVGHEPGRVSRSVSGITAALILGVSRAIGETMIVAIVAGGTGRCSDLTRFRAQP